MKYAYKWIKQRINFLPLTKLQQSVYSDQNDILNSTH